MEWAKTRRPGFVPAQHRDFPQRRIRQSSWASQASLFNNEPRSSAREPGPPAEIDCLRHILPPQLRAAAIARSEATGVGADRVLIQGGWITEDRYLQQFARATGVTFEPLAPSRRPDCPLDDAALLNAAASGLLPIHCEQGLVWVIAPRGFAARRLARLLSKRPDFARLFRLTTTERMNAFVLGTAAGALGRMAEGALHARHPKLSAAPSQAKRRLGRWIGAGTAIALPLLLMPYVTFAAINHMLASWFLAFIGLRLAASLVPSWPFGRIRRLPDTDLPVYTVVAALYREASSVAGLVGAIQALDYPPEKIDIKLVVECDDPETRQAIDALGPIPNLQIIEAPEFGPRTKPKALNCALPFARGTFLVIYDAEDRPDPGQLRTALDAFREGGTETACAQARLCIDNGGDGWLAAMFTAEYAGQFDVFLPGFSRFKLPLPLGGTSNHFRLDILRRVGGWDPYNVTEDADLGIRLARFGYRSVMIASSTYEEAPFSYGPWIRQRTRWLKGWMQTWLVHMREPVKLWREIGLRGFLTLQLSVVGGILTALVHPIFVFEILSGLVRSGFGDHSWIPTGPLSTMYGLTISTGYLATIIVGAIGLARRRMMHFAWALALTPLHWLLLSVAAWRALFQLITDPYRWEKTDHGKAKRPPGPPTQLRNNDADLRQPPRAVA